MVCPNCGKETGQGNFCNACGASLAMQNNQLPQYQYTTQNPKKGLGITALVLAIMAGVLAFVIPVDYVDAPFLLGIAGMIFGIIGIVKKNGKGMAIAGLIISILVIIIALAAVSTIM